jgi:lysozyme
VIRALVLAAAGAVLASCAQQQHARVEVLGDAKPHPGVARAHRMPIHGIDVSKWQGKIDWASVGAAGTQFAFIKATEGGDHLDARFIENWQGAKRAGIPRSAYHFMFWCRPAEQQAAWFNATCPRIRERCRPCSMSSGTASRNCAQARFRGPRHWP